VMCITSLNRPVTAGSLESPVRIMSTGSATVGDDLTSPVVEFSRILVATDFSEGARTALECALAMGRRLKSKVFLLHAIPPQFLEYAGPDRSQETIARAKDYAAAEIAKLTGSVDWAGVPYEAILREGPVWPVVRDCVSANRIELAAFGTCGRAAKQKMLLGSVAEEIFRTADFSTLTVAPHVMASGSGAALELKRILFATNFKPHAERAARVAYCLECQLGTTLAALHVVEEDARDKAKPHEMVHEFLMKRLKCGIPETCVKRCEPEVLIRFGDAAEEILRAAVDQRADLVVLGLRTSRISAGQLPSPTAYRLVCQSPCAVLTHRSS
jgi:nucleotide-binding universal stress UspA family protein